MTIEIRKQIEWHFYNYAANKKLDDDKKKEIAESGITMDYSNNIQNSNSISNPTEAKGILICGREKQHSWASVVENVKTAFEFEIQNEIIQDKFGRKIKYSELVYKYGGGNRSVYDYRYNKIIDLALLWAQRYNLIKISPYALNYRA